MSIRGCLKVILPALLLLPCGFDEDEQGNVLVKTALHGEVSGALPIQPVP